MIATKVLETMIEVIKDDNDNQDQEKENLMAKSMKQHVELRRWINIVIKR